MNVDEASCSHVLAKIESNYILHICCFRLTNSELCALIFRVRFAQGKIFCMIHGALITLDETATTTLQLNASGNCGGQPAGPGLLKSTAPICTSFKQLGYVYAGLILSSVMENH